MAKITRKKTNEKASSKTVANATTSAHLAKQTKQARYEEHVQLLTRLCEDSELFHTADRRAYITFEHDGHRETWEITGKPGDFRDYITLAFFNDNGTAPDNKAVKDVENQLMTRAKFRGAERPVFVRVGEHDGATYLDLCDRDWRAVRITAEGWEVVANPACKFLRAPGMMHLPEPVRGGSVHELDRFIHLQGNNRILYLTALTADFRYGKQFPITLITGEQDTGKTTLALLRRALIDPSKAPVTNVPRNERDLYIACRNSWLLAYDNQSRLGGDLSDVLSLLATGGAFRTRQLWSDSRETIFEAMRPIIFTSIEDLATRSDFLRRTIHVHTTPLHSNSRVGRELLDEFMAARPCILGAVLDVVSAAMRKLPTVRVEHLEGNPDFIKWGVAAEEALGFEPGSFLRAYQENRAEANRSALDACPITEPLFSLVRSRAAKGETYQGTTKQLLYDLALEYGHNPAGWPRNERALTAMLARIAPNLRAESIEVQKLGLDTKRRVQVLEIKFTDDEQARILQAEHDDHREKVARCQQWLCEFLQHGDYAYLTSRTNTSNRSPIVQHGIAAGFQEATIREAGARLGAELEIANKGTPLELWRLTAAAATKAKENEEARNQAREERVQRATLWLTKQLSTGPKNQKRELYPAMTTAGIRKEDMEAAAERLGVTKTVSDKGKMWMLPTDGRGLQNAETWLTDFLLSGKGRKFSNGMGQLMRGTALTGEGGVLDAGRKQGFTDEQINAAGEKVGVYVACVGRNHEHVRWYHPNDSPPAKTTVLLADFNKGQQQAEKTMAVAASAGVERDTVTPSQPQGTEVEDWIDAFARGE